MGEFVANCKECGQSDHIMDQSGAWICQECGGVTKDRAEIEDKTWQPETVEAAKMDPRNFEKEQRAWEARAEARWKKRTEATEC